MFRLIRALSRAVRRVRQNHALEHATMHTLGHARGGRPLAGCTVGDGFLLLGPVRTDVVESGVLHALRRLQADPRLAVHPRCGTNLSVWGLLALGLLLLAELDREHRGRTWCWRGVALGLASLLAPSAAIWAQSNITTTGHVDGLRVVGVRPYRWGRLRVHHVVTQSEA